MAARSSKIPKRFMIEDALAETGRRLSAAFLAVFSDLPEAPQRPRQLEKLCGIGKDVASRILRAIESEDPVAVLHRVPGPAPLRQILQAAARRGVSPERIAAAHESVDQFEALIRREAGDRGALDVLLSGWLPEAREKIELLSKQAIFRGISQLRGVSCEALIETAIVAPSADPERLDTAFLRSFRGLLRWRHDAALQFSYRKVHPPAPGGPTRRLDGGPIEHAQDLLVAAFSTITPADLDVSGTSDCTHYAIRGEQLGRRSAADVTTAELSLAALSRYRDPAATRKSGMFSEVHVPARLLVFDVFLQAEVYPESEPQLFVFDTTIHGTADVNDPKRSRDRLPLHESVTPLGTGLRGTRIPEGPRHPEFLAECFARLGWTPEQFRGYRVRVEYPPYGAQVTLAFERAARPT